jgi:hypothetical protein
MKRLLIALSLCASLAALTTARAEEKPAEKKDASKPTTGFADPSKLTEKAPDTFKAKFEEVGLFQ